MYANYMMTGQAPELDIKTPELSKINISKLTDSLSDKVDTVKDKITSEPEKQETYLYKWRDENGVIHYTSEKPSTDIRNLESIKIDKQTNVVPAVSNNSQESQATQQQNISPTSEMPTNVYSPEGIEQLFDHAKNVQNLIDEQFSQQEQIINNN